MNCGDAGHVLASGRVPEDLAQYSRWREHLHELAPVEVKHGVKIASEHASADGLEDVFPSRLVDVAWAA
jgi:hypothetical protein